MHKDHSEVSKTFSWSIITKEASSKIAAFIAVLRDIFKPSNTKLLPQTKGPIIIKKAEAI